MGCGEGQEVGGLEEVEGEGVDRIKIIIYNMKNSQRINKRKILKVI